MYWTHILGTGIADKHFDIRNTHLHVYQHLPSIYLSLVGFIFRHFLFQIFFESIWTDSQVGNCGYDTKHLIRSTEINKCCGSVSVHRLLVLAGEVYEWEWWPVIWFFREGVFSEICSLSSYFLQINKCRYRCFLSVTIQELARVVQNVFRCSQKMNETQKHIAGHLHI